MTRPLSYDLHTEFAMWRHVLQTTRDYYINGHLDQHEFQRRLSCMGFTSHEVKAEQAFIDNEKLEAQLTEGMK